MRSEGQTGLPGRQIFSLAVELTNRGGMMRTKLCGLIASITFTCIFSVLAWAQTDTGRIVGTVKDATGAVIPGATITVVSDKTGQERTTTSNESGGYVVTTLPAATYTV